MSAWIRRLESAIQDIRYGARLLWRSPGFTGVSIVSLALGLASAVALFAFMNALLFRPLPGRQTADIQRIYTSNGEGGRYRCCMCLSRSHRGAGCCCMLA